MSNGTDEIILEVRGLKKRYGDNEVLRGVDLKVTRADVFAVIGPNGCGKSTLLRCLNLLDFYQEGEVLLRGETISSGRPEDRPLSRLEQSQARRVRRRIGMVFQQINLFPHMSVLHNVMIGPLKVLKKTRSEAADLAEANLKKVGLWEKANADPSTLSGGQQQRVGIARALAMGPDIILFDEATSALDPGASKEVFEVIDRLAFQEGTTMVLVTHDMQFAFGPVPDDVIFMKSGVIQKQGTSAEMKEDAQVREFAGR